MINYQKYHFTHATKIDILPKINFAKFTRTQLWWSLPIDDKYFNQLNELSLFGSY